MLKTIYKSTVVTGILTLLLCGIYPAFIFVVGRIIFPQQSNGSLLQRGEVTVGSSLIGQGFSHPDYFHGRLSAAGDKGYDASSSSGSNLGPTNMKLIDAVKGNIETVIRENPGVKMGEIPVDLVTSSGSGLDPHISPEAARIQVARVAKARRVSPERVQAIVERNTSPRQTYFLGEMVVNVLKLNLDLDKEFSESNGTVH